MKSMSVNGLTSPCYECADRCVGCHAECDRYQAYWLACEAVRAERYTSVTARKKLVKKRR